MSQERATDRSPVDLEIRIFRRTGDGYPVEITLGGQQEFPRGYLAADIVPWTGDGQTLFDTLLADSTLRQAWAQARGQAPQRRIRLRIDPAAAELHALPWEMLQEGQVMLSAHADTPLSRYLPIALPWSGAVDQRPIRVLVAISNPVDLEERYNLPPVDVDTEREILASALSAASEDVAEGELELVFLDAPVTPEQMENALREGYHVLHFVGHGAFSARRGQAALYMQNQDGTAQRVLDSDLVAMIARQSVRPQLVTLIACQSATRATADAFAGMGPKLVSAGVPAVVAMQDVVSIDTARAFEAIFYRRLLEHGYVDQAVNEARSTLLTAGRSDAAGMVTEGQYGQVQAWSLEPIYAEESATGIETIQIEHESPVQALAFSPDGRWVASGGLDRMVYVWSLRDAAAGEQIAAKTHGGPVQRMAFSPDGQWMVSRSEDRVVQVWSIESGQVVAQVSYDTPIEDVSFSPDGRWVAVASAGTVQLMLWQSEDLIDEACARLPRNLTYDEWIECMPDDAYQVTCANLPPHE